MNGEDEVPAAMPPATVTGHAEGQGQVYQVARGNQHISYSNYYYGLTESKPNQHPLAVEQPPGWEYRLYAEMLGRE